MQQHRRSPRRRGYSPARFQARAGQPVAPSSPVPGPEKVEKAGLQLRPAHRRFTKSLERESRRAEEAEPPVIVRPDCPAKATSARARAHNAALQCCTRFSNLSRVPLRHRRLTGPTRTTSASSSAELEQEGLAPRCRQGASTGGKTTGACQARRRRAACRHARPRQADTSRRPPRPHRGSIERRATRDLDSTDSDITLALVFDLMNKLVRRPAETDHQDQHRRPGHRRRQRNNPARAFNLDWINLPARPGAAARATTPDRRRRRLGAPRPSRLPLRRKSPPENLVANREGRRRRRWQADFLDNKLLSSNSDGAGGSGA